MMRHTNGACIIVVGPLGFEPRIANAPGWDTKPLQPTVNRDHPQSPSVAILRPQQPTTNLQPIDKTIEKRKPTPRSEPANHAEQITKTLNHLTLKDHKHSTVNNARRKLNQLSRVCNLDDPNDVEHAISYAEISNTSKNAYVLMYQWYTEANGLTWKKPHYKVQDNAPMIPTTSQVSRIISASTTKYATIFKVMTKTAVEPEELHQVHRNQFDPNQNILTIKGLKGHGTQNYPLPEPIANMLKVYLAKYTNEYPFPSAKSISEMWRRARAKASTNHNDPTLLTIPVKVLRNYSGAQRYLNMERPDPITVMRHFRHKRMETTMNYLRNMVIDTDPKYDVREAKTAEEAKTLGSQGYTKFDEINGTHLYRKRQEFE